MGIGMYTIHYKCRECTSPHHGANGPQPPCAPVLCKLIFTRPADTARLYTLWPELHSLVRAAGAKLLRPKTERTGIAVCHPGCARPEGCEIGERKEQEAVKATRLRSAFACIATPPLLPHCLHHLQSVTRQRAGTRFKEGQSALGIRHSARPQLPRTMTSFSRCIQQHFMCCWPFVDLWIEDPPAPRKSRSRRRHRHSSPRYIREVDSYKVRERFVSLLQSQFATAALSPAPHDHMLARTSIFL